MAYTDPTQVIAPQRRWKTARVLLNTGQGGWSVARGFWDESSVHAMRWNGADGEEGFGNPQSRGHPTWFVIPPELEGAVLTEVERLERTMNVVTCDISHPPGYELGAWRIEARLSKYAELALDGTPLIFELPVLPNRLCRGDKSYVYATATELQGCFVKGIWQGHLYSNGIAENENPTQLDKFRDAFLQSVLRSVRKYGVP